MLAILDYKAGNQTSVLRALQHLAIPSTITADPAVLAAAEGIIFPGVGSAGQAMGVLQEQGLDACLRQAVAKGQPVLGICLGCQILLASSEEGPTRTLGIVPGACRKFPDGLVQEDGSRAPVPHMGWNNVRCEKDNPLFAGIDRDAQFYFVHSYYVDPAPELAIGFTEYGGMRFCSFYGRPGLWATQFHPEKSGRAGLAILKNYYAYCKEAGHAL
ncbi:MAG: imidazole glycerol phosphate synthase subunit HisH [Desulfovibrionaceae bacterium]|nr:imidazole glycerol phosphate synthase subunit HisH [Desulfovibrionaceae bacterium]